MHSLATSTLPELPTAVAKPCYDRTTLTAGIVHFGVGGFHRAHQAMYLDRLMNAGQALDWAICGVGVLPGDARMKQVMDDQGCLYTLVVKNPDGTREARVIGSIIEYLFAPENPEAVIEKMASDAVRIVSLTVTEADTTSTMSPGNSTPRTRTSYTISGREPRRGQPSGWSPRPLPGAANEVWSLSR